MEAQGPGGDEGLTPDARGRLMQEVAAQMDAIEGDYGENFQIGRVINRRGGAEAGHRRAGTSS